MKRLVHLLAGTVGVLASATPLAAQRSDNLEFAAFGSFWRFDRAFVLKNTFGGGARVGYNFSDRVGLEVIGDYTQTVDLARTVDVHVQSIGVNLVYNFPFGDRSTVYITGGLTRSVFTQDPVGTTYDFTENMVNGGIGARLFLSKRLALRLDGRAMYTPKTQYSLGTWGGQVVGSGGVSYFFVPPQQGRGFARDYQWYWGAQGGGFVYKTNAQPYYYDPVIGGHWLITARRTALYVAYEQAMFLTDAQALIFDPNSSGCSIGSAPCRDVTFHDMRRIMFGVLAFPAQKVIEPFAGGGFALMQVLNPIVDCPSCTLGQFNEAQDRGADAASKAFFWLMGGLQINYSTKFNVFAHYLITSAASGFLIEGNTHTLQGGIRYSLGTSKEGITERH
jgi:outer membrane protein with beta-barrel domain